MKDTFYFSIYQNNEDQIRIYADELKITPSALSLQNAYHPGYVHKNLKRKPKLNV